MLYLRSPGKAACVTGEEGRPKSLLHGQSMKERAVKGGDASPQWPKTPIGTDPFNVLPSNRTKSGIKFLAHVI